ncbi:MAG: GNAT family N-acetyltransferase, partial [Chloroflexota bacterium]
KDMAGEQSVEQVVIRRYRPDDAARVKAITEAAFAPVSIDAAVDRRWPGVAPVPWIERKWASMQPQLADHPEHCWVAEAAQPFPEGGPHPSPLPEGEGRGAAGSGNNEAGGGVRGGEVVGYVTCEVLPNLGLGRIPDLAVDARWRGRGLGRRLLEHALTSFRELRLPLAKIETLAHNEVGRHLYPSLGFELVATQYHYIMPLGPVEPPVHGGPRAAGGAAAPPSAVDEREEG